MFGDDKRRRVKDLLEALRRVRPQRPGKLAALRVSADELELLIGGLESNLAGMDEVQREARALHAMQGVPKSERYAAYARARGVDLDDDDPTHRKHYPPAVLGIYLMALGRGAGANAAGISTSMLTELAGQPTQGLPLPPPPRTPEQALTVTATFCEFPTEEACRRFLVRVREELRSDRTGWRADFDAEFPLPQGER